MRITSSLRTRRGLTGDDGSIVLALFAVALLLTTVGVAVSAVILGQKQGRSDRSFETALRTAEIGLDRMVAVIKSDPLVATSALPAMTGVYEPSTKQYYDVSVSRTPAMPASPPSGDVTWTITAVGRSAAPPMVDRQIQATVKSGSAFSLAVFAKEKLVLNGSNAADSYNSLNPGGNKMCTQGNKVHPCTKTGNGHVGSEGTITLKGNGSTGSDVDAVDVFFAKDPDNDLPPLPDATGECTAACPDLTQYPGHYFVPRPAVCDNATYTSAYTGFLSAGVNSFADTNITLTPQSMPTLLPGQKVILCAKGTITLDGKKSGINVDAAGDPQPASNLFIFLAESFGGSPSLNSINHCAISAAIYAPAAAFTGSAQCDIFGSMIVNSISTNGGVGFHYDDALGAADVNLPVVVSDWRELG